LLLYGSCGLGKTMLARYVLPQILFHYNTPRKITHCYSITELNDEQTLNEALGFNILSVDDVGVEENMVVYGKRRNPFDEIMDAVEKQGKLIIITTNLTQKELTDRYGTRVMDRIKATTRRVVFDLYDDKGQRMSLRRHD
jgi:DNA replication protein DnaC